MLSENDVISNLTAYLEKAGYKILQALQTNQHGIDIIAENIKHILYIEAKGETSSKEHTSRFGKAFNDNQIKSHISRAILASLKVLNDKPSGSRTKVGIALPNTIGHRKIVSSIGNPLRTLGIKIFFVSEKEVIEQ